MAAYPTVRGIYLWNLAGGEAWANLPNQLQRLIAPMAEYAVSNYFVLEPAP